MSEQLPEALPAQDYEISRRVLNLALYNLGHVAGFPSSDNELLIGLYRALRPIVGGNDGLLAARRILERHHG